MTRDPPPSPRRLSPPLLQGEHEERDDGQRGEVGQHRLHPRRSRHLHQVVPPETVKDRDTVLDFDLISNLILLPQYRGGKQREDLHGVVGEQQVPQVEQLVRLKVFDLILICLEPWRATA